jgi:hypothetical protein
MIRTCASGLASMYRWVVRRFVCPASICTSRSAPPTVDVFRAALVMKVPLLLWLEQPRPQVTAPSLEQIDDRLGRRRQRAFRTLQNDTRLNPADFLINRLGMKD